MKKLILLCLLIPFVALAYTESERFTINIESYCANNGYAHQRFTKWDASSSGALLYWRLPISAPDLVWAKTNVPSILPPWQEPMQAENGIETPTIVLQAATNRVIGVGVEATPDGDLFTYTYHASPINPAQVNSNRAAALAKKQAAKTNGVAGINGQLQNRIENLERFNGWRP